MKEVVGREEWLRRLPSPDKQLYAMYSSVTDCIVTDSAMMVVPVDDHMVHRGDGVFESFKCLDGCLYNLEAHLDRLASSCEQLGLKLPQSAVQMAAVVEQTVRAGGVRNALVRLLVSRGRGTMGINPYACSGEEWYVVVYELPMVSSKKLAKGLRAVVSEIPVKPAFFARVKTCNYLPNVLMKKEAIDQGVDLSISLDEDKNLAEGATENVGIVTRDNELFMPPFDRVLAGTTAQRAMHFAQELVAEGVLTKAEYRPISLTMAREAAEIHIYGTTTNVTPVVEWEGRPVGDGSAGLVAAKLFERLSAEMVPDSRRLRKVF